MMSELLASAGDHEVYGIKTGYIYWYDFTKKIYCQAGYDTKVTPVTTAEYEYGLAKAVRPLTHV